MDFNSIPNLAILPLQFGSLLASDRRADGVLNFLERYLITTPWDLIVSDQDAVLPVARARAMYGIDATQSSRR